MEVDGKKAFHVDSGELGQYVCFEFREPLEMAECRFESEKYSDVVWMIQGGHSS